LDDSKPCLIRLDTGEQLSLAGRQIIGRDAACDHVIQDMTISGRHAAITVSADGVMLQDLKSWNGTFIDGRRISGPTMLTDRQRFRLNELELEFRATEPSWAEREFGDHTTRYAPPRSRSRLPLPKDLRLVTTPTLYFAPGLQHLLQLEGAQQRWTIGRGTGVGVRIDDNRISTRHATLIRNGRNWRISELVSMNGTFVNGSKINQAELKSGDQLAFGPVSCVFLLPRG
jgi:ABC transport system ATP-binding/permease protein